MPQLVDRILHLLGRELRILQRRRCHGDESIGVRYTPLGQAFIVCPNDRADEIPVRRVPPLVVDGQRRDIDASLVHGIHAKVPQ